jgi:hypothetical protein
MSATLTATRPTIFLTRSQYIYRGPQAIQLTPSGIAAIPARRRAEVEADARRIPYEAEQLESWTPDWQGPVDDRYVGEYSHHDFLVCEVRARRATFEVWAVAYILREPVFATYQEIPMEHRLVRYYGMRVAG